MSNNIKIDEGSCKTSVMTGRWPFWLFVTRVTTVSVNVFLVMLSLKRPSSVGGGGNWSSWSLRSFGSAGFIAKFIEADDIRRGGSGGEGDGDGYRGCRLAGVAVGTLVRTWEEDFKLLFKGMADNGLGL